MVRTQLIKKKKYGRQQVVNPNLPFFESYKRITSFETLREEISFIEDSVFEIYKIGRPFTFYQQNTILYDLKTFQILKGVIWLYIKHRKVSVNQKYRVTVVWKRF